MGQERQDFPRFFFQFLLGSRVQTTSAERSGKANAEVQFITAPHVEQEQLKGENGREGGGER